MGNRDPQPDAGAHECFTPENAVGKFGLRSDLRRFREKFDQGIENAPFVGDVEDNRSFGGQKPR